MPGFAAVSSIVSTLSPIALESMQLGQEASLAFAASYFPRAAVSHASSSNVLPFTPASAALSWQMLTANVNLAAFFVTDDSHLSVALSGGTKPVSSPPNGVPARAAPTPIAAPTATMTTRCFSDILVLLDTWRG